MCRVEDREEVEEKEWANFFKVDHNIPKKDSYQRYDKLSDSEWEGCLGVACVISINEGVAPNLFALSKHLDIPHYDIHLQRALERLRVNGVLSKRFGTYHDPALNGRAKNNYLRTVDGKKILVQTGSEVERNAWCTIAGIASGYVGMREKMFSENHLQSESIDV